MNAAEKLPAPARICLLCHHAIFGEQFPFGNGVICDGCRSTIERERMLWRVGIAQARRAAPPIQEPIAIAMQRLTLRARWRCLRNRWRTAFVSEFFVNNIVEPIALVVGLIVIVLAFAVAAS